MKKLLALLLAGAMTLSCVGCGGAAQTAGDGEAKSGELIPMKIAF